MAKAPKVKPVNSEVSKKTKTAPKAAVSRVSKIAIQSKVVAKKSAVSKAIKSKTVTPVTNTPYITEKPKISALKMLLDEKNALSKKVRVEKSIPVTATKKSSKLLVQKGVSSKNTKISITNNTKRAAPVPMLSPLKPATKKAPTIIPRTQLSIARLSPFRLPAVRQVSMANVARFVGIFFVALGGFFSLVNFQYIGDFAMLDGGAQQALTGVSSLTDTTQTSGTVIPQTSASFTFDQENANAFVDTLKVTVTLQSSHPELVSDVDLIIGSNNLIRDNGHDGNVWKFEFNTNDFPKGRYPVQAIVNYKSTSGTAFKPSYALAGTYAFGALETDSVGDTTHNEEAGDTATTTVGGTSISSITELNNTEAISDTNTSIRLSIDEGPVLRGGVSLDAVSPNATAVILYAHLITKNSTPVLYTIGPATRDGEKWKRDWNSRLVPNGDYRIFAKAEMGGVQYSSTYVSRTVENDVLTTTIASTTTITPPDTTTLSDVDTETTLNPLISLTLSKQNPLDTYVEVVTKVSGADRVELYAVPRNGLSERFVGRAQLVANNTWKYAWDTRQTPNGEYDMFARVKTSYGDVVGPKVFARVLNDIIIPLTTKQVESIDRINEVGANLIYETDGTDAPPDTETDHSDTETDHSDIETDHSDTSEEVEPAEIAAYQPAYNYVYVEPVSTYMNAVDWGTEETEEHIKTTLREYRSKLNDYLDAYSKAIRRDDAAEIMKVKSDMENLKNDLIVNLPSNVDKKDLIDSVNSYLSKITFELQELTEKNEKIIRDRVGDAVYADSDSDGVTDYDEVHIYFTNPFSADTDGDGFVDGAEIQSGYNALDSTYEAYVYHESPKDTGVIRDDILAVNSISTLKIEGYEAPQSTYVPPAALISGTALPNSFVTLYIFSTPIVVTVKTDETGSWSYIFDKELEDGEHEVYIGITDNAGRIIAKSNPFSFVKTAEAYTGTDAENASAFASLSPSFISANMMLLIASIAVVALGLVLILLGIHVSDRRYPQPIEITP